MHARALAVACALVVACDRPPAVVVEGDPALPGIATPDRAVTDRLAAALVDRLAHGYHPHAATTYTNRLILETSPYLVAHAHNPINWFPWSDDAFARARREHKLVLLSIGYATCHWCHVMAADAFETVEVAAAINASYIAIKVDREERPDVDAAYLDAVIAMTGNGGWPMTLVVDADRRPVFGATFLRKAQLLEVLARLRATEPAQLAATAASVMASLAEAPRAPIDASGAGAGPEVIERGARALASAFDPEHGGFGRGTKFPRAPDLELLLRYHRRTDDPRARAIVERTLGAMATGGIHDQLGGGFHRYATDRAWRIPHFEKMLYDNAQLATLYLAIGQVDVAVETLDYLARELRTADGGFASASDADSRAPDGTSVEGYYYTWTPAEVDAAAGEAAPAVRAWFGIGEAQVDGRSVLHVPRAAAAVAAALGIDEPTLAARLASARPPMLAARATRAVPARDDKVVASWNGLAIGAFARAGFALDRADYLAIARRAATLVLAKLRTPDGGLARSYTAGRAGGVATLTDYASVVAGLLDLFAATSERSWLEAALALAAQLEPRFGDRDGGFFMTEGAPILVRGRPIDDGAEPSANAVAALDLVRLAELTGDPTWRARAARVFAAFNAELARGSASALRSALEAYLDDPISIVIVGEPVAAAPLVAEVRRAWLPNASIVVVPVVDPALAKLVPAVDGKRAQHDLPTAYVCVRELCRAPTQDPATLARQLATVAPLYPDRSPPPLPSY